MPTPKKFWVQDGHVEQYPAYVQEGRGHFGMECTACHGGDATKSTRAEAHAGFSSTPTQSSCAVCHPDATSHVAASQHTSLTGFDAVMATRGLDGTVGAQRFDKQCTKCHVANAAGAESSCGHCHVSVPATAGGGFLEGHVFRKTPSMDNNCTACHGSRVKDEYYALNNELLARNAAVFPADSPWNGFQLQPDVHKAAGKTCGFCHSSDEMHGVGTVTGDDRYTVSTAPLCTDCHVPSSAVRLHTPKHLETMTCHVCHAQPYKNCFGCHTDEKSGIGYYGINENDPTRVARSAPPAWSATTAYAKDAFVTYNAATYKSLQAANTNHLPDEVSSAWWVAAAPKLVAGDALMTFRIGLNPRASDGRHPQKYAVLRHVPIDRDVFRYSGTNAGADVAENLFGAITSAPTWKFATPHTIARKTPITASCLNCHYSDAPKFWLTDPVDDALGWVGHPTDPAKAAVYQSDERAANGSVVVPAPVPMSPVQ